MKDAIYFPYLFMQIGLVWHQAILNNKKKHFIAVFHKIFSKLCPHLCHLTLEYVVQCIVHGYPPKRQVVNWWGLLAWARINLIIYMFARQSPFFTFLNTAICGLSGITRVFCYTGQTVSLLLFYTPSSKMLPALKKKGGKCVAWGGPPPRHAFATSLPGL